ncbi:carbonic anhydrase [Lasiosphaeria miniovina]|uniref:Carbonic anhydrase n=1 Tax=Lasiosphaeria miniovina TaxID=1954250 RepID=A0AA39ZYU4_9PEZI|nr:carbonic anhydrase [Lasiosphaeria miniovina]KAK0705954.1 carbonic anhydrase [Lasiosphaeria miniovina]
MDPRCIPERYFNLGVGEVVVHRNAGGNVRHALRDIGIVEELFHVAELAIVHHTDCGTLAFTEDQVRGGVKARVAREHWADVDRITFGANADLVESVKGDVAWVRAHPLISDRLKQGCQGFVFDIKTGEIEKVNV